MTTVDNRPVPTVRASASRWKQIDALLIQLERLVQLNTVLDLETGQSWGHSRGGEFETRCSAVVQVVGEELSVLTCELLAAELKRQKMKDMK